MGKYHYNCNNVSEGNRPIIVKSYQDARDQLKERKNPTQPQLESAPQVVQQIDTELDKRTLSELIKEEVMESPAVRRFIQAADTSVGAFISIMADFKSSLDQTIELKQTHNLARISNLELQLSNWMTPISQNASQVVSIQTQVDNLVTQGAGHTTQLDNLKTQVADLKTQVDNLKTQLDTLLHNKDSS